MVVAGLAVAGWAFHVPSPGRAGGAVGGPAPPIELVRLDEPSGGGEGTVSLAALRGRPVVVNFFASWCVPCRKELPAFRDVAERYEGRVAFLGVNHQDTRSGGRAMLDEFDVPYAAGYDPKGEVAVEYGLFGMPSTVFVSAEGELLERHTGELSAAQLEESIDRLFGIARP